MVKHDAALLHGSLKAWRFLWWHHFSGNHITALPAFTHPRETLYTQLPPSLADGANQTNNKSVSNPYQTASLPSAIISMVYLFTALFLKAGRGGEPCSPGWLLMSLSSSGTSLSPLTPLFIWKSLGPVQVLLMQKWINGLIIISKRWSLSWGQTLYPGLLGDLHREETLDTHVGFTW